MRKDLCEKLALEYAKLEYASSRSELLEINKDYPQQVYKMDFFVDAFIEAYNNFRNMDLSADEGYSPELSDPDEISE